MKLLETVRYGKNAFLYKRTVINSGMFDEQWFCLRYYNEIRFRSSALQYFLTFGRQKRLSPSKYFDTERYLEDYEDARQSALNPLVHYLKIGLARGYRAHRPPPSEADRILASGLFDARWYLERYPDVARAKHPALLHFMQHGASEGRSPSQDFDTEWYLSQNPDIRGLNPLLHYVDFGLKEGRLPVKDTRILATVEQTLAALAPLDPELMLIRARTNVSDIKVRDGVPRHQIAQAFGQIVDAIDCQPKCIVFLPWLVHGGADLVASHFIKQVVADNTPASILVIFCDHDREEALHLLPTGVKSISLSRIAPTLSLRERADLIDVIIRAFQPLAILNVNSHSCWEAMKLHGARLSKFSKLYAMLFCPDYDPDGTPGGYGDLYFRHCIEYLSAVYFDNKTYIDVLRNKYCVPEAFLSKLIPVYQPYFKNSITRKFSNAPENNKILWCGRFTKQKNIDLLLQIARGAPQYTFEVWGRGDDEYTKKIKGESLIENIRLMGPYNKFDDIPIQNYQALLYTSLWDGLPNILLEAAAAGLPIVAPDVGGISEIVTTDTGWLVKDIHNPLAYVQKINSCLEDASLRTVRLKNMLDKLESQHSDEEYRNTLYEKPLASKGILYWISRQ